MEFVTFIEHNHKEDEVFVFYLQWTGNEHALNILSECTVYSCSAEMSGDYSDFEMDISVKFTEEMVNQHCKLDYGSYMRMFKKVTGKLTLPDAFVEIEDDLKVAEGFKNAFDDEEIYDGHSIAQCLDEQFYGGKIAEYFE